MPQILTAALALLAGITVLIAPTGNAHAQKRVALVIGNSAYLHTPKLTNPKNDATDIAAALKKHGFQVIEGYDLDKAAFERNVRDFAAALKGADAGVLFYAGHGLQVSGVNYLVPIDAKAEGAETLEFEMIRVNVIHSVMEQLTTTNILFLDACRNNPLARNLARTMGTRSTQIGRGLKTFEAGLGTLISFSTAPDTVASDGTGRNSPFTGALVRHITASTDDLAGILVAVRNDVIQATRKEQVPWEHSALVGRFFFGAQQTALVSKVAPSPLGQAATEWDVLRTKTDIAEFEAFAARHQGTYFADMAKARLDELRRQQRMPVTVKAEKETAIQTGDIVEQWRIYHPASGQFFPGQDGEFLRTKWKVREILQSGVRLELVEGKYKGQKPGHIEQFSSSDSYKQRFPQALAYEQILHEFRRVPGG